MIIKKKLYTEIKEFGAVEHTVFVGYQFVISMGRLKD
jgi:hypothetical protein